MRDNNVTTYIIIPDTLRSIGLKYLLREYFEIDAIPVTPPLSNDNCGEASQSCVFITTPETFANNLDFFIPRRSRTLIFSTDTSEDISAVNLYLDESEIIDRIESFLKTLNVPRENVQQNTLSQREIDVLRLIAMGYINKEIADKLNISFNTVLSHRKNITSKLGIKSASGLGFYAIMNGYVSENDIKKC